MPGIISTFEINILENTSSPKKWLLFFNHFIYIIDELACSNSIDYLSFLSIFLLLGNHCSHIPAINNREKEDSVACLTNTPLFLSLSLPRPSFIHYGNGTL